MRLLPEQFVGRVDHRGAAVSAEHGGQLAAQLGRTEACAWLLDHEADPARAPMYGPHAAAPRGLDRAPRHRFAASQPRRTTRCPRSAARRHATVVGATYRTTGSAPTSPPGARREER